INCKHPERPCFALLFSTDLALDPIQLYRAYKARFQVEFIFRDAKQFTGLTDCQARDAQKLDFHFNASLSALNLAKYEQFLQHDSKQPFIFSMSSYKRRKLNQHLLERFINNLELDATSIKSHPNYQNLCDYGSLIS
ncbi:MAG: IS4 family transposase, partial [Cyanobacteria bacterium J06597_16]